MQICQIFKQICTKVYDPTSYHDLKFGVVLALCCLEKVFPPSFFNLMTHLTFHLVDELDICGLVHSCWMYPIEKALKRSKGLCSFNMCKPEASMAEGYIFDEALGLCTKYMESFCATRRCVWDVNEEGVVGRFWKVCPNHEH